MDTQRILIDIFSEDRATNYLAIGAIITGLKAADFYALSDEYDLIKKDYAENKMCDALFLKWRIHKAQSIKKQGR